MKPRTLRWTPIGAWGDEAFSNGYEPERARVACSGACKFQAMVWALDAGSAATDFTILATKAEAKAWCEARVKELDRETR